MKLNVGGDAKFKQEEVIAEPLGKTPAAVLLFGSPGSGKTRTIAELLMRDEVLLMLHCGLGLSGESAIREYLRTRLSTEEAAEKLIRERLRLVRIDNINKLSGVTNKKLEWIEAVLRNERDFLTSLTTLVVEEFNGAQGTIERNLVPMIDGFPRQTKTRTKDVEAGTEGTYGHYADLKMITEYVTTELLSIPLRQVWSAHENAKLKAVSDVGDLGPWIQTKAVIGLVGAFSFCVRTKIKRGVLGEPDKYLYGFKDSIFTKAQKEGCPAEMKADPIKLWDLIEGKNQ